MEICGTRRFVKDVKCAFGMRCKEYIGPADNFICTGITS